MEPLDESDSNITLPAKDKSTRISTEDVDSLINDNSVDNKIKIVQKVAKIYNDEDGTRLTAQEVSMIEDIFRTLIKAAESQVRIVFSECIKNSSNLPKDIAVSLARDIEEVSIPILEASQVLDQDDLMDIVNSTRSTNQLLAIARRTHVSPELSASLLEKDEKVTETLLNNLGAELSKETYDKIIENSASNDEVIVRAIVEKGTMPVTVMEKLLKHVNGEIRKELDEKYQVVFESLALKKELERNLQTATMNMLGRRSTDARNNQLLKEIGKAGKSPPFAALTSGDYEMFEISMARLTSVPLDKVKVLLADSGGLGLQTLYQKANLPVSLLDATIVLTRTVQTLVAEQPQKQLHRKRVEAAKIINRIRMIVGEKKIKNLDFFLTVIEYNIKWVNLDNN